MIESVSHAPILLTRQGLYVLTRRIQPAAQVRWLTHAGWKFARDCDGYPVVAREEFLRNMLGTSQRILPKRQADRPKPAWILALRPGLEPGTCGLIWLPSSRGRKNFCLCEASWRRASPIGEATGSSVTTVACVAAVPNLFLAPNAARTT